LARVFRSFRFDGELYAGFVGVCGCTVTGAFERFMRGCVAAEGLVFAKAGLAGTSKRKANGSSPLKKDAELGG